MTCQMLTWIKRKIHGYKLDRLSACEFATIGFYSSLDNVEVEEQASDTPLQITSMGEETKNEEEEDLPIQT
ncbi:hypothetical protein L7F22_067097 [Adiantum nelumboides]|nr:hypothetical protein [Adiantum nelumboides]